MARTPEFGAARDASFRVRCTPEEVVLLRQKVAESQCSTLSDYVRLKLGLTSKLVVPAVVPAVVPISTPESALAVTEEEINGSE